MHSSLQTLLYERLQQKPDGPAIAFYDGQGDFSWLSFEAFYGWASRSASWLAQNGLGKGDVCLIVLPSNEFCARTLAATLLLGAVPLLVAPPFLQEDSAYSNLMQILLDVIWRTKPAVVVCPASLTSRRAELEQQAGGRFLFGEETFDDALPEHTSLVTPCEMDVVAMQLTSGTTGSPRVCVWQHKNMLAVFESMKEAMKLNADDICLNWTPLYHDMGLVNNFLLCLSIGIPLVMMSPHDFIISPARWLRALSDTRSTQTWSPNFGFALAVQRIRDEEIEGVCLDHVRAFWSAAERIHLDTMQAFFQRFSAYGVRMEALKTNFGCAENIGGATFSDPHGRFVVEWVAREPLQEQRIAIPVAEGDENGAHAVSIVGVGRPFPGMQVHILSEDNQRLPDGCVGQIALQTPSRMTGYLGEPEVTARVTADGLLRTGDLGYTRDGELFWVGRVRERINIRGVKLDPSDFETVLLRIPGLRTGCFVAFGLDDAKQGTQQLIIVSELRDEAREKAGEIRGEISREILSRFGVRVRDVMLVREGTLTKTSSGKRRHRHFKKLYQDGMLDAFAYSD